MIAHIGKSIGRLLIVFGLMVAVVAAGQAGAAETPVGLGTAASFAVLGGQTVTNTGPSTISGDVGVSPGSAVTNFPPGLVTNGVIHAADTVAAQAQAALTTAYNDAAGRVPAATGLTELGGLTLGPGVRAGGALQITGTLTLDAGGDPNALFVFQAASTLNTATSSMVVLTGGADPCNVFWQVTSSASLGVDSVFVGTILASTSISAATGASVEGRLLASTGAVTLDTNTVTVPPCTSGGTTTTSSSTTTTTAGETTTTTAGETTTTTAGPGSTTTVTLPYTGGTDHTTGIAGLLTVGLLAVGLGGVTLLVTRRHEGRRTLP